MFEYACCWASGFTLLVKGYNIEEIGRKFPTANIYSLYGPLESLRRYQPGE